MTPNPIAHYAGIAWQFARVGVVRKSQLQAEFWFQVVMDCVWYGSHVAVFEVLFLHAPSIAGWAREDFRVLLAFLFVSDAFMMIWLGQMWRFGRDLKEGKLDPVRVRPGATFFLYAFQLFSLEGCLNMAIALGYLGYAIVLAVPVTAGTVWLSVAAVLLCCWARTLVGVLFSLFEIHFVGSDATRLFQETLHATADRPLDIFGARVRAFLTYIVPMGALTPLPAGLVLRRYETVEACLIVAWVGALGVALLYAWHRSFRRYESAMG